MPDLVVDSQVIEALAQSVGEAARRLAAVELPPAPGCTTDDAGLAEALARLVRAWQQGLTATVVEAARLSDDLAAVAAAYVAVEAAATPEVMR